MGQWGRVQGQIEQPSRFEIEGDATNSYWNVVSAHEFGVVLFRENGKSEEGERLWEVKMLDTSLKQIWDKDYSTDKRFNFKGYDYSNNQLFLLFQEGSFSSDKYFVFRIFLSNGDFRTFEIDHGIPLDLEEFMAVGESVIFGGYANRLPTVLLYNFSEERLEVIPGLYQRDSYLLDLTVDEVNNSFSVVTRQNQPSNKNTISHKTFDNKGEIITDRKFEMDEGINILSAATTIFDWGEQVVTGTFGDKNSDYARGVFFIRFQNEGDPILKTYNFSELSNYFNYLNPSRKEKIDKKIREKENQGKKLNVRSRIILHELIPEGDEYIMLGEVYEVDYSNQTSLSYGTPYWMNSFNSGYRGYRITFPELENFNKPASYEYKQAIIVGFTREGDLKWDNSLVLNHFYTPYLYQVVHVNTINNQIALIYKEGNKLKSEVVKHDQQPAKSEEEIKLSYEGDVLVNERDELNGLSYWYEDNFYTWGYQKIKNKTNKEVSKRRNVFYINKLTIK